MLLHEMHRMGLIELEYRDSDDLERMIRKLCGEDFFDGTDDGPEQSGNV